MTIKRGIKPHDIPADLFERFIVNDRALAWEYAFDKGLLKWHKCEARYVDIAYKIDGLKENDLEMPLIADIRCLYPFNLKLNALMAKVLGISVNQVRTLAANGGVTAIPECDIMKCRVGTGLLSVRIIP
jgi:hypothetical protein